MDKVKIIAERELNWLERDAAMLFEELLKHDSRYSIEHLVLKIGVMSGRIRQLRGILEGK